jgi:hypothetical protein
MATDPYKPPRGVAPAPIAGADKAACQALARFERAKQIRQPWESEFQEAYDYTMPMKESLFASTTGHRRTDKILDETGVVALAECTSRIQAGLIPPFGRWAGLEAGSDVEPDQRHDVNAQLEQVTDVIFEVLAESNLNQEAPEAIQECLLSLGCLEVEEGDALNPIIFKAIPIPRLWVDVGPDDRLCAYYFANRYRLSQLRVRYPRADIPAALIDAYEKCHDGGDDPLVPVVEEIRRDYAQPNEERWIKTVVAEGEKAVLATEKYEGVGSCPYIGFRWAKVAGESWGRGPLLNAMPAIRTCNLTIELILENAEMAITGISTVEDDGVVNVDAITLVPGTLIPIAPGSGGIKNVPVGGNFDVAQLVLNDMRANIKRALFNEMLGNPGKTPMSATEVTERTADLARQIGAAFGRLQAEFVQPLLRRVIYILRKKGLIEMPQVDGRVIKIVATSPLSRAQNMQDILQFQQYGDLITAQFGPQMKNLIVDGFEGAAWLAEKFGVPTKLNRKPAEAKQLVAQLQQQGATPEDIAGNGPTGNAPA